MWALNVASENRDLIGYYRTYVAIVVIEVAAIPLLVVLLLASVVLHLAVSASVFVLIIAVAALCMAIGQAIRLRLFFRSGQWRSLDGRLMRRADRPGRFWTLVAVSGATLLAPLGAGLFLIWMVVFPRP